MLSVFLFRGGKFTCFCNLDKQCCAVTVSNFLSFVLLQELEEKRKQRALVAYERRKRLAKLRSKAEKTADEKLEPQLEILAPIKY